MMLGRTFIISEVGTGCTFYLCHCQTQYFRSELPTDSSDEPKIEGLTILINRLEILRKAIGSNNDNSHFVWLKLHRQENFQARL